MRSKKPDGSFIAMMVIHRTNTPAGLRNGNALGFYVPVDDGCPDVYDRGCSPPRRLPARPRSFGSGTLRHEVVTRFSKALRDAKGICTVTWATIPSPRVATRAVRSRPPPFRRDRAGPVPE